MAQEVVLGLEAHPVEQQATPRVRTHDVVDQDAEIPDSQPLRDALLLCRDLIAPAYQRASANARRHHRSYRLVVALIATFWTAALIFAIMQLPQLIDGAWLSYGEVVAAVVSLAAVSLGLFVSGQPRWLTERHKAERLRGLKFRFITDPRLWSGDPSTVEACKQELRDEVDGISKVTKADLEEWTESDELPAEEQSRGGIAATPESLRDLVNYYMRKRIDVQRDFFRSQIGRHSRSDSYTRWLPPVFFFGSATITLVHFVYNGIANWGEHGEGHHASEWSLWIVVVGASLPVLGAGVRTLRASHEYARNIGRYRSKLIGLNHVAEELQASAEPEEIFRTLRYSELILEAEHRDWLRLMSEAEWVG
jgi:hypothetical protein